jgi:hypothetical protein
VLRQLWKRLAHKQWLVFYPLALAIINTLAFLAVYGAAGGTLGWGEFFSTNFDKWLFVRDHFVSGFSFTPALGIAVFAGLAACVFSAMLRAPLFRAIAGSGYPLAPRSGEETGRLTLYYVFFNLLVLVLPLAVPSDAGLAAASWATSLVALFFIYADYIIVYEGLAFLPALRRSARLLSRRWVPVLVVFVLLAFLNIGLHALYARYYDGAQGVFLLIPLSEILIWSFISLVLDLFFIFLYEQVRNQTR